MKSPFYLLTIAALGLGGAAGWFARDALDLPATNLSHKDGEAVKKSEPALASSASSSPAVIAGTAPEHGKSEQHNPSGAHGPVIAEAAGAKPPGISEDARAAAFREGEFLTIDLLLAVNDRIAQVEFRGNGRDTMRMVATNRSSQPVRLSFPQGQTFESASGKVTLLRPQVLDLLAGETRLEELSTVALASTNELRESTYVAVSHLQGKLQPLLDHLASHPEVPAPAAQTAALAITENLPASAFAKFAEASDLPAEWNTAAFRVETFELLQALMLLRTIGYTDDDLAITIDPQTKIEAMIDPLAHAYALQYYRIDPENEWPYWKNELLKGAPNTRHYALHGIARNYPDVALEMLPQWVRETRTSRVYRLAAVQALAMVHRPEALELLKTLQGELGGDAEFAGAFSASIKYLGGVLDHPVAAAAPSVGFRLGGVNGEGGSGALTSLVAASLSPVIDEVSDALEVGENAGQAREAEVLGDVTAKAEAESAGMHEGAAKALPEEANQNRSK